jgi:hypothetical protein
MRFIGALGWMLWALLLASGISASGSARMEQLPELELVRELSLSGNRLSELEHNRTYHGLYRWNCSHEAFFPYACKDGEPAVAPAGEVPERAALLQFAWVDRTKAHR